MGTGAERGGWVRRKMEARRSQPALDKRSWNPTRSSGCFTPSTGNGEHTTAAGCRAAVQGLRCDDRGVMPMPFVSKDIDDPAKLDWLVLNKQRVKPQHLADLVEATKQLDPDVLGIRHFT